ncbi:MAG: phosphoglucosamine mutase [Microbacteriaceae bacterium]|nr:phosphoglucosamine mutase [Microbacteriaceae bacterium]
MARLFGTDGVRGVANGELTATLALELAQAAAAVLSRGRTAEKRREEGRKPIAIVARDTRISGAFLNAAVTAGLASSGVDVLDAGVLPTPALAYLVADTKADLGVVISASHNPFQDNGIKFFAVGGTKLPDEVEDRIEAWMHEGVLVPTGAEVGERRRFADAEDRYVLHLLGSINKTLDGLHIVIDAANGAASAVAPQVFADAGAKVTLVGAEPNGTNINDGVGSVHIEHLQKAVVEHGADFGIALDGDADRVQAVDAEGRVVDGDQIMAILAVSMKREGKLRGNKIIATVMSNIGLHTAMKEQGIKVEVTGVGDRYVLEKLAEGESNLGGEQSGHIILADHSTTGDGLLAGLKLAEEVVATKKSLAELASVMKVAPQTLINVSGVDKTRLQENLVISKAVADAEAELGESGRILLRPSGTEKIIRVMVEATEATVADEIAGRLASIVRSELS